MTPQGDTADDWSGDAGAGEDLVRDLTQAEAAAEFETLADNIPTLCWMARADGHIYWYNRRWYEYTGTSIDTQKGWGWETVHDPEVLPAVAERWRHSLATGTPFEMTFPLKGADGRFRPFLTRVVPIRGPDGAVDRWFGTNTEIESLQLAQQALQQRTAELQSLYDSAPIGLALVDRDFRYVRINPELAGVNAIPAEEHVGRSIWDIVPAEAPLVQPVIERVFATGEAVSNLEVGIQSRTGPPGTRHFLAGFYPIKDEHGLVEVVGAWVVEITERKAAQDREALLAREVDHRAKNLLAVVQSIVQLTPGEDGQQLKASVIGRIQALARAHSLLSDARWDGVDLGQLVAEELAPFGEQGSDRVRFGGPPITLRPAAAQSLALVLHELATNAAKYGALSDEHGQLDVAWRRDQGNGKPAVEILWSESGGAGVVEPRQTGFGSNIIRTSVERQLRGTLSREWRPQGLVCRLWLPSLEVAAGDEG